MLAEIKHRKSQEVVAKNFCDFTCFHGPSVARPHRRRLLTRNGKVSYFFLARGFMLLMVVLIQILFSLGVIFALPLALGLPLYLFIQFSDFAKRTLRIAKGRIP